MTTQNAKKTLENVPPLQFWGKNQVGWYCLAGAVTRYLEYIGDPVLYSTIMGVSGAAWRLVWNIGKWSPDNLIMNWYGHLAAEDRIFKTLGYQYEYIDRKAFHSTKDSKNEIFKKICTVIDSGKPVIADGIAGPEECLIAGYDKSKTSLFVQSFFEHAEGEYFEVKDWYEYEPKGEYEGHRFSGLLIIGLKSQQRQAHGDLTESLKWGLQMARMGNANGRACGIAAYDAWAKDMLKDEDFPLSNLMRLEEISMSISDNGIVILDSRKAASDYLTSIIPSFNERYRSLLGEAAILFEKESKLIGEAHEIMPWGNVKGDALKEKMKRANREKISKVILDCKSCYEEAFRKIEEAIKS